MFMADGAGFLHSQVDEATLFATRHPSAAPVSKGNDKNVRQHLEHTRRLEVVLGSPVTG